MCTIQDKYTQTDEFTGYKIALKHKETGEYISCYTGVVYEVGKVRPAIGPVSWMGGVRVGSLAEAVAFNEKMQGKTGVFIEHHRATIMFQAARQTLYRSRNDKYQVVLLEMTIKGDLHTAYFLDSHLSRAQTIIGSHITAFKEIEYEIAIR